MKNVSFVKQYGRQIFFLVLVVIVGIGLLRRNNIRHRLMQHHAVACARIMSLGRGKHGPLIDYEFAVGGKKYTRDAEGCTSETGRKYNDGRINYILVVFNPDNPHEHEIIEDSKNFNYYNLTEQDTSGLSCN